MNKANPSVDRIQFDLPQTGPHHRILVELNRIKLAATIAVLAGLMGCVGYVEGGYGGAVVVPPPYVYFYGGIYERGPVIHSYSHRGFESRSPHFHEGRR